MIRILIAEDEPLERQMLQDVLQWYFSYTADIRAVTNGMDAVSTAAIWNADVVLMDIEMPGLNGIQAALKILENRPRTKCVFVTAYESFEYAREAVRLRAVDYLLKPVEDKELINVMERILAEKKQEELLDEQLQTVRAPAGDISGQSHTERLIRKVGEYIQKNYQWDISQDMICDILNMSTGHFSKMFRQCYGVKFIDYLTNVRVEAAKALLADPTKRTKEIGTMVGYQSSSYFSKMFKQKTGMTPSEYRDRVVGG